MELKEEFILLEKTKALLDPFKEEKEEDIKRLKNIQLELHEDFIKVVKKAEDQSLKIPKKIIFLLENFGQENITQTWIS